MEIYVGGQLLLLLFSIFIVIILYIQLILNNPNKRQRLMNLSNKLTFLLYLLCSGDFGIEATMNLQLAALQ